MEPMQTMVRQIDFTDEIHETDNMYAPKGKATTDGIKANDDETN